MLDNENDPYLSAGFTRMRGSSRRSNWPKVTGKLIFAPSLAGKVGVGGKLIP